MLAMNAIFDVAGSGLSAENTRLTTSAGNLANANVVAGSAEEAYKAQYPIFTTIKSNVFASSQSNNNPGGVNVTGIYASQTEPSKRYEPNNPLADKNGFVFQSDVNYMEEMANMISAARAYEVNLEMINTTKQLVQRTLHIGE